MISTLVLEESQMQEVLAAAYSAAESKNLATYSAPLYRAAQRYGINTPLRLAHFVAQVGHECGQFKYMEEIASGAAYEGRKDLGNAQRGDGRRFKGRGAIALTGRANYTRYAKSIGELDLLTHPQRLAELPYCTDVAGWYWKYGCNVDLNRIADKDNVVLITKLINGGYNGLRDRQALLRKAKAHIDFSSALAVQKALNASGTVPELLEDGKFGPQTASVVREFQAHFFLKPTGVVDAATWETIVKRGWNVSHARN